VKRSSKRNQSFFTAVFSTSTPMTAGFLPLKHGGAGYTVNMANPLSYLGFWWDSHSYHLAINSGIFS